MAEEKEAPEAVEAVLGGGKNTCAGTGSHCLQGQAMASETRGEFVDALEGVPLVESVTISAVGMGDGGYGPQARDPLPLPCLNSNISDKKFPPHARKTAYNLRLTIEALALTYGIERLGFFTVTFVDEPTPKEASRRMDNLNRRVFSSRFLDWVQVYERGAKSGRLHFHLVVALPFDCRTGCNFEAFERCDYRSAPEALRAEWAYWRSITNYDGEHPRHAYGQIGRCELLPVKSTAEGIRNYVGKYVEKHMEGRKAEDKGVHLLRMSKGARRATNAFAWHSPVGMLWRKKLAKWAERMGYLHEGAIAQQWGRKWAHRMRGVIMGERLSTDELCAVRLFASSADSRKSVPPLRTALAFFDPVATERQIIAAHLKVEGIPGEVVTPDFNPFETEAPFEVVAAPGQPF